MDKKVLSKNVAWNMIGSIFYLACQWLVGVAVVRFSDNYENAGTLSLAMSVTNIFSTVALFNVRNLQVSDSIGEYSPTEYHTHRLFTCALALLLCAGFVLVNRYSLAVSLAILFYMCVRLIEAYEDVLQGMAQNKWRLDIAGKSLLARGLLQIVCFSVFQILFDNLALSIATMALSNLLVLFVYDIPKIRALSPFGVTKKADKLAALCRLCLPMLIYGISTNSIVSGARYLIEKIHGSEVLGYYATVSTLAVLVQTFVTLIFTPFINLFEVAHRAGEKKTVRGLLLKLLLLLVGVTAAALLAVLALGKPVMSLVFGKEILPYVYLLYPMIAASALTALMWLLSMLLVVLRDTVTLMVGGLCGIALCITLGLILIPQRAYFGANTATISSLGLVCVIFAVRVAVYLFGAQKPEKEVP